MPRTNGAPRAALRDIVGATESANGTLADLAEAVRGVR
jgi:hypothetical protein